MCEYANVRLARTGDGGGVEELCLSVNCCGRFAEISCHEPFTFLLENANDFSETKYEKFTNAIGLFAWVYSAIAHYVFSLYWSTFVPINLCIFVPLNFAYIFWYTWILVTANALNKLVMLRILSCVIICHVAGHFLFIDFRNNLNPMFFLVSSISFIGYTCDTIRVLPVDGSKDGFIAVLAVVLFAVVIAWQTLIENTNTVGGKPRLFLLVCSGLFKFGWTGMINVAIANYRAAIPRRADRFEY